MGEEGRGWPSKRPLKGRRSQGGPFVPPLRRPPRPVRNETAARRTTQGIQRDTGEATKTQGQLAGMGEDGRGWARMGEETAGCINCSLSKNKYPTSIGGVGNNNKSFRKSVVNKVSVSQTDSDSSRSAILVNKH